MPSPEVHYPGASFRPLPENATEPLIRPTQVILHSAVSPHASIYDYFAREDVVVESHLYVAEDGETEQYIELTRQADANYKANGRAISVETWDRGDPDRVMWTNAQLERLADILVHCHMHLGIPLTWVASPESPGIGYHSLYNGIWTPGVKSCPGVIRIPQIQSIIDAAALIVSGNTAQPVLPSPTVPKGPGGSPLLRVDGVLGPRTYTRLQESLNRTQTGQDLVLDGIFGEKTKRALQRRVGALVDGIVGPGTIRSLQRILGVRIDSVWGPITTRALQSRLNTREL